MGNDNSLIGTIVGILFGAILYFAILISLIVLELQTGINILPTPPCPCPPPNCDPPAYSLNFYDSIWVFSMYGFVIGGAYIGWLITCNKKSEEYYAVRKTFVIMGILSIIWIILTIVFYLFEIDIGWSSPDIIPDIIMGIILLIGILYLSSIDSNRVDKKKIGMWTGMLGALMGIIIFNILEFFNIIELFI